MNIPKPYVPLMMSAVRDAVLYNEQLLTSDTLRNRDDYEEHLMHLSQFFEFIKEEYKAKESEYGLPLEQLIKD